jgi:hypothetical protein
MVLGVSQNLASAAPRPTTRTSTPTHSQNTLREWLTREEILKTGGPVMNSKDTQKFLAQNSITFNEGLNMDKMAEALLRALSDNSSRHGNYLCVFALILESYREDKLVERIEEKMTTQIEEVNGLLMSFDVQNAKLHETTEKLWMAEENIRGAAKEAIDDYAAWTKIANGNAATNEMEQGDARETRGKTNATQSYATAARQGQANHAPRQVMLDKSKLRNRRIIIDAKGDNVLMLTKEALVTKANMAIEMLSRVDYPSKPEGVEFVSVKKLRNGGLEFELNKDEAANWVKSEEVRRNLADKFGNSAEIRLQGHTILVKNTPLYFKPDDKSELMTVARVNHMDEHEAIWARWMKPPERRHNKQTSAHVALTLHTVTAANDAIRHSITIRGKRCTAERLTREATRCNKCQRYGRHFAAQCQAIHGTCGTCGSIEHTTKDCKVGDNWQKHRCVNCSTNGHAAWSRDCPTLKRKNHELTEQSYEAGFKYFVTDEPDTWEQLTDDVVMPTESNGPCRQGFQPTTADWGYGHDTLPGQAPVTRMTNANNGQRQGPPTTTQTTLHGWGMHKQQQPTGARTWFDNQDPIQEGGWDDPYPYKAPHHGNQTRNRQ